MSILDPIIGGQPGNVGGGVGGGVLSNIPGSSSSSGVPAGTSPLPYIFYNGKVINLPTWPRRWQADPHPLTTFDLNEDASSVVTSYERLDIQISGEFPPMANGTLRDSLLNFWQGWASKGYGWYFTLDATHVVNTTLISGSSGSIMYVSDPTGVSTGRFYKVMNGFDYELVEVTGISGNTLTLRDAADLSFPSGSVFRDQGYYRGVVRDGSVRNPVVDLSPIDDSLRDYFRFAPEFYEDPLL